MMTVGHVLAFVLLLYMITAIDADVTFPKPRSSFVDLDVFKAEVAGSSYYKWKTVWEFTVDNSSTLDTAFGPEYKLMVSGASPLILTIESRTVNLNTDVCSENAATEVYYLSSNIYTGTGTEALFVTGDASTYNWFISSNPTQYVWLYVCEEFILSLDPKMCPEDKTRIKFLYNQGAEYNRPEGIPWARALKDLYQATKLNLDVVQGPWRAAYVYKEINIVCSEE